MKESDLDLLSEKERELLSFVFQKKFEFREGVLRSRLKKPKSENRWKFVVKKSIKFLKRKVK